MSTLSILPQNPLQKLSNGKVRLYFIGTPLLRKPGQKIYLYVRTRLVVAPEIGDSVDVRETDVRGYMEAARIYDPVHGFMDGFTTDPLVAKAVKEAYDRGAATTPQELAKALAISQTLKLTDEELEAELERRRQNKPSKKG